MDKLLIRGGRRLAGTVQISGAKNASLPELFASLLTAEPVTLRNLPRLHDVSTALTLLGSLGVKTEQADGRTDVVTLTAGHVASREASYDLVKTMRASILVLGPLLGRFGRSARVAAGRLRDRLAAGSTSTSRVCRRWGAEISVEHGYIVARAERLRGARNHDRHGHRDRHREPADGRLPGRGRGRFSKMLPRNTRFPTSPRC